MGSRGKPKRKGAPAGGLLGQLGRAAGGAARGAPAGRSGTFRVYPDGSMVRVPSKKRRKRGYVMPKIVRDQLEASRRLTDAVAARVLSGAH